jgi:hypothetical protein
MFIQLATIPGRDDLANEDFAGAFPGCAVLLDGAGGPAELPTGCSHRTAWYVRQLGARLLAAMETSQERSLTAILADGITAVCDLHRGTCDLTAPGTPASVVVMARAAAGRLDYLVLGDSTLVIDADGDIEAITDRRIDDVAGAERLAMERLPTGTPEHHSVPLDPIKHLTLLSDGATRFTEFGLGTWRDLLDVLDAYGASSVFARIRAAEQSDPAGIRWPRAKRMDDAAIVHFTSLTR